MRGSQNSLLNCFTLLPFFRSKLTTLSTLCKSRRLFVFYVYDAIIREGNNELVEKALSDFNSQLKTDDFIITKLAQRRV